MFHSGDLQSGISTAIRQQKLVACFIRSDDEVSRIWEEQWLPDLSEVINDKAVLLRIEHGSQEAGFLSAFCPVEKAPALAVIRNGQVLEKIEGGASQDEFGSKLMKAVGFGDDDDDEDPVVEDESNVPSQTLSTPSNIAQTQSAQEQAASSSTQPQPMAQGSSPATGVATTSRPAPSSESAPAANMENMFPNRAQRMEAEAARQRAIEKQERIARARARREEAEAAEAAKTGRSEKDRMRDTGQDIRARQDWLQQQKKRKDEAKEERERILKQIENDRLERKRQDEVRKEAAQRHRGDGISSPLPDAYKAERARASGAAGSCAIQVRLFDGSSVKGRFASDTTLATGVRTWIRESAHEGSLSQEGGRGETPFGFRQILAPQPSRSIEISEENMSLLELGLTPNATLVLVPVTNAQDAYAVGGASGIFGRVFTQNGFIARATSTASGIVGGAFGIAGSVVSYVTGSGAGDAAAASSGGPYMGGTQDEKERSNVEGARMANHDGGQPSSSKSRVKTLADQRAEEERTKQTEFYNGNSLGFEGRKDEDEESR